MSEQEQRQEGGLMGERGTTTFADRVVSEIAGISAQGVEGVHMGGGASRAGGGVLGSVTGSQGTSRGISVEVGQTETALDLTMALDYGRDILETVEEVRRRITESISTMTGLKVTELNVTVNDIVFPEDGDGRRSASGSASGAASGTRTRTTPRGESGASSEESATTRVSPSSRTRAQGTPSGQDETQEIKPGDVAESERSPRSEEETRGTRRGRREE